MIIIYSRLPESSDEDDTDKVIWLTGRRPVGRERKPNGAATTL